MQLNAAARAVFASNASGYSLHELIAPFCSTSPGRRRLQEWLESACVDVATLQKRHDVVARLVTHLAAHAERNSSKELRGVAQVLSHFQAHQSMLHALLTRSRSVEQGDQTSMQTFTELRAWILRLESLLRIEARETSTPLNGSFLIPLNELCQVKLAAFCNMIRERTDSTLRPADNGSEGEECGDLHYLKRQISQCEADIQEHAGQTANKLLLHSDRVKVIYNESLFGRRMPGVVFRASRQDFHRVQQQSDVALTLLRSSKSSGVWFSTPSLEILSASWTALQKRLRECEQELVNELIQIFQSSFLCFVDQILALLEELDVLLAFARLAWEKSLVRATISDNAERSWSLRLVRMFDPFATNNKQYQAPEELVDITLECQNGKTLLVLTNHLSYGHRLLYLIGVVALMNQIGGFVPCASAELPLFNSILVRAGAFDQQFHGQSTFKTEMLEINAIFTQMTPTSLVLIDDLCRGTSSDEGLALGVALCRHLMDFRIPTCVASQWTDLTDKLLEYSFATMASRCDNEIDMEAEATMRQLAEAMEEHSFPVGLSTRIQLELQRSNHKH